MKKTQQYTDFVSAVDVQVLPDDEKFVEKYWITVNVIRILTLCGIICGGALTVIFTFMDFKFKHVPFIVAIILFLAYFYYRYHYSEKILKIFTEECDAVRYMSLQSVLMSHANARTNWGVFFYNMARTLLEIGRVEDAEKVNALLAQYCTTYWGRFYYETIAVELAGYKKNYEEMEEHCVKLSQIETKVKLNQAMRTAYIERMQYPNFVRMSENGAYQELYNIFNRYESMEQKISARVQRNYYLYKIALKLGNEKKAEEHKAFVLQRGGNLRYRSEIENS